VIAYKFLDGRTAPFTRFVWPEGEWVDTGIVAPCRGGVHACRVRDLPYWLGPDLWKIELEGEVVEQERKVVAARGRLVRRLERWTPALLEAFATDLLTQTRLRFGAVAILSGYVDDVERFRGQRRFGLAAFAATRAAELSGGPAAYERERARQAEWIAKRLGLTR
jgi:hypothetical protein